MSRSRQEQIALLLIQNRFRREGRISWKRRKEIQQELEDEAKTMFSEEEAATFAAIMAI